MNSSFISLSIGITGYLSPKIKSATLEALNDVASYQYSSSAGIPALREKIANELNQTFNYSVSSENVLITSGAISGIFISFFSLLNKGDEVLLPWPTYPSYTKQINLVGAKPKYFDCFNNEDESILTEIKNSVSSRTKMLVLCTPNNPTGKLIKTNIINQIITFCNKKGIIILIDETYSKIVYSKRISPERIPSRIFSSRISSQKEISCSSKQFLNNVINIRSFSKDIGVSGLRLGYVYANSKLIEKLSKVAETINICPSTLSQNIILGIYQNGTLNQIIKEQNSYLTENLSLICIFLNELKDYFDYTVPEGGMFIFVKLKKTTDDKLFCREMFEGVSVSLSPGSYFGAPGYVRISFGAKREDLINAFKRIRQKLYKQREQSKDKKK